MSDISIGARELERCRWVQQRAGSVAVVMVRVVVVGERNLLGAEAGLNVL